MTGNFMKKHVGIFRMVYPAPSEAFITEQTSHLKDFEPTMVATRLIGKSRFPSIVVNPNRHSNFDAQLYALSRRPELFKQANRLKSLGLLHAHFGPDGVYAMPLAKQLNIPLIVTYHGFETVASKLAMWLSRDLANYQFLLHEVGLKREAAAIIAVSKFIEKRLIDKGYSKEKIIQHYIGVDTEKFTPALTPALERYILCVGRHTRRKGIDTLLRAFARIAHKHPEVSLLQVGAGPLTVGLKGLAAELGIERRVRFAGNQPHDQVVGLMRGAEIFALPSRTSGSGDSEALGIVFNEASACGVPVVSTHHGGIPEAVRHGETGLLAPENDDQHLAQHLDALLGDRAEARRMGVLGREFACEMFDIRRQTAKLEAIYCQFC
jgi:colanic acid/amylovoran biosynthesis glycosyltransferase